MLAAEGQMRWFGVNMCSRRRRRWVVALSYVLLFTVFTGIGTASHWGAHPYVVMASLIASALVLGRFSIFGKNGPVKDRDRPSLRLAGADYVQVTGLDERARYRFGVESFEAASDQQKEELLNTHRAGARWMPKDSDHTPWLDERELKDRDYAERWALKQILLILGCLIGIWFSEMVDHGKLDGYSVVTLLLFVVFLSDTLPKARALWTEPDPRELGGEMTLVGRPEGRV